MIYEVRFDPKVRKVIAKWKKSNPVLFKKLSKIVEDIMLHPRTGLGHPEALVGGEDELYSRHITANDRIIYRIIDREVYVLVLQLEGHYSDK